MNKIITVLVLGGLVTIGAAVKSSPSSVTGADPLHNANGLSGGLMALPDKELPRARALIRKVKMAEPAPGRPYDRSAFGTAWTDSSGARWSHDGCPTREQVLQRDMPDETFRSKAGDPPRCVVASGTLSDPYTGSTIVFSKDRPQAVQIDHVIALSEAWRQGAWNWSKERRETYANDPLVLLAVDGPANVQKSDHGPSEWLPPNHGVWCSLAVRRAQIELSYHLPATSQDKHTMLEVCS